jgi:ferrochelatase
MTGTERIAVVLFNLGGPDRPETTEPFLFNLFNDPAVIEMPKPLRWVVARVLARRRTPVARQIYGKIGGSSPILANTLMQAEAVEQTAASLGVLRCFVAMRYWRPFSCEVVAAVKSFGPGRVVLIPLYPQFSTTTTASSVREWVRTAREAGMRVPTNYICCYPRDGGFVDAVSRLILTALGEIEAEIKGLRGPRVLFSAHGLPKRVVARGDPYQWQVEETCAAIVRAMGREGLDWRVCYQSRVGPLEWIEPATDQEIERAGKERVPLVVVPIAFVSEHSETLVELDIEYRNLARRAGVPAYVRVPTVSVAAKFIEGLVELVRAALEDTRPVRSGEGSRICPTRFVRCPMPF